MKILIAPDSFKDSLSAHDVAKNIEAGIKKVKPEIKTILLPIADGGEGTVHALLNAKGGKLVHVEVHDPLMRKIKAHYGILSDNITAIIEMASSSGLELLKINERNPMETSTYGLGEMIKDALDHGCRKIIIGLGGSATNDAGSGMIMALGGKLLDGDGKLISHGGKELSKLKNIELSEIDQRLTKCEIIAACDVTNPLYGHEGSAYVFAPQKGATPEMVKILDENLKQFSDVVKKSLVKDVAELKGAGAAGGLGAGLFAFLSASILPGFEIIKELTDLENKIKNVSLVITGEGKIDFQTSFGKAPHGVALLAKKHKKPVIALVGILDKRANSLDDQVFDAIIPILDKPMSLEHAIQNAESLIQDTVARIIRILSIKILL